MKTFIFSITISLLLAGFGVNGQTRFPKPDEKAAIGQNYLRSLLNDKQVLFELNYPNMTKGLYQENGFNYIWFNAYKQVQLADAMMMLDCVIQYGLVPDSYHPRELTYDNLQLISEDSTGKNLQLKAKMDLFLTDAIISFMVHLHFGRINPFISKQKIDSKSFTGFRVDSVLKEALKFDFQTRVLSVQPGSPAYRSLQYYMRLAVGQYVGDCYEISEDTLKLVALNLERYKWQSEPVRAYIDINIPSFTLTFKESRKSHDFKVIVGKPSNPSPVLISNITSFNTAPDWNVPYNIFKNELLPKILRDPSYLDRNKFTIYSKTGIYIEPSAANLKLIRANPSNYLIRQSSGCDNALGSIVFYFNNPYSVYLHDTPQPSLFNNQYRALSHGCIRVERPKELATLLLKATAAPEYAYPKISDAMDKYQKFTYTFKKPVPIVVRYITCEVKDDALAIHKDIYKRDKELIDKLFSSVRFTPTWY
ncbi:MAG: L,D-transpeptidase family protein [Sphingobacteriaceae bacterium]